MGARIEAFQRAVRADPDSPHRRLWLEDLRQARKGWLGVLDQAMVANQATRGSRTVGEIEDALARAAANTATRLVPKSAQAQMRFLVKAEKGSTRAVAARLGVTQRTVERYLKGTLRRPRAELAARLEREVRKDWQPRVQQRAKKQADRPPPPEGC